MRNYAVQITGLTPLLMHHDNIEWADHMDAWKADPGNKTQSKAGDDRTPAWRWIGCVYHDGKTVGMPQANIMRAIMEGGALVPVPGGKSGKTFKSQTQSGMMSVELFWSLELAGGGCVEWSEIEKMTDFASFAENRAEARKLGFDLMVKRAKIGTSKHIRVRPVFALGWRLNGTLAVWDDQITDATLVQILEYTGRYKGLGDWRPGGKTPGPYGTFTATVVAI